MALAVVVGVLLLSAAALVVVALLRVVAVSLWVQVGGVPAVLVVVVVAVLVLVDLGVVDVVRGAVVLLGRVVLVAGLRSGSAKWLEGKGSGVGGHTRWYSKSKFPSWAACCWAICCSICSWASSASRRFRSSSWRFCCGETGICSCGCIACTLARYEYMKLLSRTWL